jgi:hypothetical protein
MQSERRADWKTPPKIGAQRSSDHPILTGLAGPNQTHCTNLAPLARIISPRAPRSDSECVRSSATLPPCRDEAQHTAQPYAVAGCGPERTAHPDGSAETLENAENVMFR